MLCWRGRKTLQNPIQYTSRSRKTTDTGPVHCVVCPFTAQLSLVLINRPRRDGTLSWRWYAAAMGGIRTRDIAVASPAPYHSATARIRHKDIELIFTAFSEDHTQPARGAQPNISPVTDESQTLAHYYDNNQQPEPTDAATEPVQQPDGIILIIIF